MSSYATAKITSVTAFLLLALSTLPGFSAPAKFDVTGSYWGGIELGDGDIAINRLSVRPAMRKRWGRNLELRLAGELDWSDDETGLGGTNTYAPLSKPFTRSEHFRLELARATLRYRAESLSVTLGKQSLAWGVLDGLRVADRVSPVRRRDFILMEQRPERLGRWGIRTRTDVGTIDLDAAVLFDNTADQSPRPGDAYFPIAARSLAGFSAANLTSFSQLPVADRSHGIKQATYALKLGRRVGKFDLQLIGLHGPDTEPLVVASAAGGIELQYPTRSLIAVNLQRSIGATVLRFEGAVIPDQRINLADPGRTGEASRVLLGMGIDFKLGSEWFINAQLGVDALEDTRQNYARPRTDVVTTIRAQRSFMQERLKFKSELIGSPKDKDGYLGTALSWQFDDRLLGTVGVDWLFGDRDELFGQFSKRSRGWLRVTFTP